MTKYNLLMFELRGKLTDSQTLSLGIIGAVLIVLIWWALAEIMSKKIPDVETTRELPSSLAGDSLQNAYLRDSILLADSIKMANATSFKKIYPNIRLLTKSSPDLSTLKY